MHSMHDFSNIQLYKHVLMHTFNAKLRFCVPKPTTFQFRNRCTALVERIAYMFAEINVFTSLNTANIDVATLPECIPCMISATYSYTNMC